MAMAEARHLALLRSGVKTWNAWRQAKPTVRPNLCGVDLTEAELRGADLSWVNLNGADLSRADLTEADLRGASLYDANLGGATLGRARLTQADLSRAYLRGAHLAGADLSKATLVGADLWDAQLTGAHLTEADLTLARLDRAQLYGAHLDRAHLRDADLTEANLSHADLTEADLSRADLTRAILTETSFVSANLDGCRVYGISAWNVQLDHAIQTNLRITPHYEALVTVDRLEVAQFLYLMLHNQTIAQLIESLTSNLVLIVGRFTPERTSILDALRDALRQHTPPYVPVLFDVEEAGERNLTEMATMLARLTRFIIADITDPVGVLQTVQAIVPRTDAPIVPIIAERATLDPGFAEYGDFPWVLDLHRYPDLSGLVATVQDAIIAPAEAKVHALRAVRKSGGDDGD